MIDVPALMSAFDIMGSSLPGWGWIVPGLIVGLLFSAIPGVSVSMAMAIVLPLSLYMDFFPAVVFLTSVYTGAGFGGSVPAILMNIPGSPSSFATTFDGYEMTKQGLHNEALGHALFASTVCCIIGYALLFVLIEPMAKIVLKVGPLEMFFIAVWGMLLLGSLGSKYVSRGLLAAAFGIVLGTVGMNTAGYTRGTLGLPYLLDGISPIPAMIGLLAAGQLLTLATQDYIIDAAASRTVSLRRIWKGCWDSFKYPGVLIRGTIIGIVIGAVPGVGSSVGNLISYAEAKRTSKNPASFGKGNPEGVIAAEASVASAEGGSMATMLALGIPGGGATAILLAAFLMHNIVPGPNFIRHHMDMVYAIIINNVIQAIVLLGVGILFIYAASYVVKVRTRYILPAILVIATMGTYAIDGNLTAPFTLFIFAIIGTVMTRYEYPVSATVVGLLLGRMIETQTIQTFQVSGGKWTYILERPGAMGILAVMLVSFGMSIWAKHGENKKLRAQAAADLLSSGHPLA